MKYGERALKANRAGALTNLLLPHWPNVLLVEQVVDHRWAYPVERLVLGRCAMAGEAAVRQMPE